MVMPLAFAPFNFWPVSIAATAILFYLSVDRTPRQGFLCGYLFGIGMFGAGVNWLHISINQFGGMSLTGSLLVTMVLVLFLALYPALTILGGKRFFSSRGSTVYLFSLAVLWILFEWLRAWLFTGFPWLQIGYAHADSPLSGLAPVTGIYGTGLAVTVSSCLLVLLARRGTIKRFTVLLVLLCLWLASWVLGRMDWVGPSGSDISVALIQGGIPQDMKWQPQFRRQGFELYLELSEPFWNRDLIVWPETALPVFLSRSNTYLEEIETLRQRGGGSLLLGIPVDDPDTGQYFNSALLLGSELFVYHKRHLVPFGEYLPLKFLLGRILNFLEIPMSDFTPGKSVSPVFDTGVFRVGISICYEATFGSEIIQAMPDAEFLINISNDAWFGDSLAPHQHLQMARMRALETSRFMLRATNTGITAIIDNKGRVIRRAEQFNPAAISDRISLYHGLTPYAATGDIPVIMLCMFVLLLLRIRKTEII